MKDRSRLRDGDAQTVLAISDFKARCLEILQGLRDAGGDLIVTKHGEPIARVSPIRGSRPLRGLFKGQLQIKGEIVHSDFGGDWDANR
jgi:prevent-host-death family protein